MNNYQHSRRYTQTTLFYESLKHIPAFVIICNAAGKISEEDLHASL